MQLAFFKRVLEEQHRSRYDPEKCAVRRAAKGQPGYAKAALDLAAQQWPELGSLLLVADMDMLKKRFWSETGRSAACRAVWLHLCHLAGKELHACFSLSLQVLVAAGGKMPHEVSAEQAAGAARQVQQEAAAAAAEVLSRIPSLEASWADLKTFMDDVKSGSTDDWLAHDKAGAKAIVNRCSTWAQRPGFTQQQRRLIIDFDTHCRQAFA